MPAILFWQRISKENKMRAMKKVLITGTNGFLGQKLLTALASTRETEVIGVSRSPDKAASQWKIPFEQLDITNTAQVNNCFQRHQPDTVIHTAAISQTDRCEKNQEDCRQINIEGTANVLRAAERLKAHFIFLSTDFVFDGNRGPYREEDTPHPLSVYGKSKWTSEQAIMKSKTSWAILRTILVYGILPVMPGPNIITFVKNSLEKGERIKVVSDQIRTPTLIEDLVTACLETARRKAEGLFHISGKDPVSIYDFAQQIAKTFGLSSDLIEPVLTGALQETAARPKRTGFILEKAERLLGYRTHSLRQGLEIVRQQMQEMNKGR